jgi:hypothetical protein
VELATSAETLTGTATDRVVTPDGLSDRLASPGPIGGVEPDTGAFDSLDVGDSKFVVDSDGNVSATSFVAVKQSGTAGRMWSYEANSTDTSKTGFEGPASTSADLYFKFSNSEPTVGQAMRFGAPSTNVSAITWYLPESTQSGTHTTGVSTEQTPTWTGPMHTIWCADTLEINLPAAAGYAGKGLLIYVLGSYVITLDPSGTEVLVRDGTVQSAGVTVTLTADAGGYVGLFCDGVRWVTLGFKGTLAEGS